MAAASSSMTLLGRRGFDQHPADAQFEEIGHGFVGGFPGEDDHLRLREFPIELDDEVRGRSALDHAFYEHRAGRLFVAQLQAFCQGLCP